MLSAEFEVKVRLVGVDPRSLVDRLASLGFKMEEEVEEEDHYFDLRGCPGYKQGTVLRFRRVVTGSTVKYRLTYKGLIASEGVKARNELEADLPDGRVLDILRLAGLKEVVIRKRRSYFSGADLKVSLDEVECLGGFLEFEEMNPQSAESFLAKVRKTLSLLGIPAAELITESYLELYLRQRCLGL